LKQVGPTAAHEGAARRRELREINKDTTLFKKSYQRPDLHADVAGLGVEAGAELIEEVVKEHWRGTAASPSGPEDAPQTKG
jgi:hypothetical protein